MHPLLLLALLSAPQQNGYGRQETPSTRRAPAKPGAWTFEGRAEGGFTYDSNVWLLDGGQRDRLEDDRPSDQASGRFDDMESVDDLVFTPDLRLEAKGPSPFGRRLTAFFDLEYAFYTQNSRRSHLDLGLGAAQAVGARGQMELSIGFVPELFRKNYLADAVDANANGDIASDERIYEDGTYREWDVALEYRHDLVQRTAQSPFGLRGALALGLRDRTYDSPFDHRDEDAPFVRLGLRFEHGPRVKWGLRYAYEAIDAPNEPAVVLVDEIALGQDVNGDAILANDARAFTPVDRARVEHSIALSFAYGLSATVEVELTYERLLRDWESDEALDFSHRGREDTRDEFGVALRVRMAKGWDGRIGWEWREQHTDRSDDPGGTGDTVDYKRHLILVSAVYHW